MAAAPELTTVPILGLTGAVAAGKSEALAALAREGAATLSADAVVHELLASERVRDLLVGQWGADVAPDGEIDRAKVGSIVFSDPEQLAWLEATLHPLVGEEIAAWRAGLDPATPVAVIEVPLLFETEMHDLFDATVTVVAPDDLRADRHSARGLGDLEGRSKRQLTQDEKAARADYVVRNDGGLEELEQRIRELIADFTAAREGR